jgi:uracil-DNA glycosylase
MLQNELFHASNQPQRLTRWQPSDWPVGAGWGEVVAEFLSSATGQSLGKALQARLEAGACIFPPAPFRALELTPLHQVRVVILGQDPYHGAGQAEGLAFSVAPGVKIPPSLRNIFKEIQLEGGKCMSNHPQNSIKSGSLTRWAAQGVLLLNTCLTVEEGLPASHAKLGWEVLTDALLSLVAKTNKNVVFMLWGAHAQAKQGLLQSGRTLGAGAGVEIDGGHLVLCANHPSPLSALRPPAPFLGCNHFALANDFLLRHGLAAIDW